MDQIESEEPAPDAPLDPPVQQVKPLTFTARNPATGELGPGHPGHSVAETKAIAASARAAFESWRRSSFDQRASLMMEAAAVLGRRRDEFARLMVFEMGKPFSVGRAEIDKCIFNCEHFASNAADYLAPRPVVMEGVKAFIAYNPLGVVLAVMPWNFPFSQVFRFAAPTLMAGNAALLKHASAVPGCALAIEQVFREAGFPQDLFRTLLIPSGAVRAVIDNPDVAAVTLTGSVDAGRSVAAAAGGALKKCVLELGGSDAYIVLDDADVASAARVCVTARMVNGGQSCIAGKRFIVASSLRARFEQAVVDEMRSYAMSDPMLDSSRLGPMVSVEARDNLHRQVRQSIAGGARLLIGGEIPDAAGAWYPPTVLADVAPGQPAHDEEVFGPVAAIIEANDEADSIRIANDSGFGLGSAVLTSDLERGERIAAIELEAGSSFVNENVRSDPRMPFGGVKASGFGREGGAQGIREFVNVKSVHVRPQQRDAAPLGASVE
jgi:succinate-semialdehyde dehydrogenase/glutarate-semialdehyde dehydrogenase